MQSATSINSSFALHHRRILPTLALIAICMWLIGCNSSEQGHQSTSAVDSVAGNSPKTPVAPSPLPPPARPDTPFLNTAPHAAWAGSTSCRSCHADIASAYDATPHSKALSDAPPRLEDARITDTPAGYVFQSRTTNQKLIHTEELELTQNAPRDFEVAWTVGSGHFGHSFLTLAQGFLVQSPLTWYSTRNCWDLSPGYSGPDHYAFHRNISARCLWCHAGSLEIRDRNEYHVDIHEQAISCERCHGPGELHVAKHEQATTPEAADIDTTIVNPAHLSRQLAESVCEQCHLQGDAQVFARGSRFDDYRPGLPLAIFRQEFRAERQGEMTVVGHVEQMHASLCYQKSSSLTCVTCHHPHQSRSAAEKMTAWRNACLSCHEPAACHAEQPARDAKADRCTDCHMPKSPTELPHVAFTHHRIGVHAELSQPAQSADVGDSPVARSSPRDAPTVTLLELTTPVDGIPDADQQRSRGLALLQLSLKSDIPDGLRQARDALLAAWDGGAQDAAVAAGLARIAAEIGWTEKALDWSGIALQLDSAPSEERVSALKIRGELTFNAGRYESALNDFKELTIARRDARHWFYRGMTEQNLNQTDNAIRSLRTSLEIDPRNPGAHAALAAILESLRDQAAAQHHQAAQKLQAPRSAN